METKLRRYRSSLVTNGIGIINFGLWSLIKVIIAAVVNPSNYTESIDDEIVNTPAFIFGTIIILIIILAILIFPYLYIGLSAYREGVRGKKGSGYLIFAGIILLVTILQMVFYFFPQDSYEMSVSTYVASFLIDFTTIILLLDTIYAAIMSRKLSKLLEK